jgi:Tol biopolymer transport system component
VTIALGDQSQFGDSAASPPAVSPDGRFVIFGNLDKGGLSELWLRPFDSFEARPLAGTEGSNYAFWSPDSRHVGFFVNGRLKRIEIASGRVQPIGGEGSSFPRGGSWGPDGKILFAPNSNTGIWIIDASGGTPRQLTTPDPEIVDASHRWPRFLPDGKHYLFLLWTNDLQAREEHGGVYLTSIDSEEPPIRVVADASSMAYAPSGHLLVMQENNLMAVPFDWKSGSVRGEATVLASDVLFSLNNGYAAFSVSSEGTLVFSRTGALTQPSTLVWYDREGRTTAVPVESAPFYGSLRLSPDGRRAATVLPGVSGDREAWVVDLTRGVRTRLVPAAAWTYGAPLWSPQGDRVLYTSQRHGHDDFYVRRADGSGEEQVVLISDEDKTPWDWSKDGKWIAYWPIGAGSGTENLWIYDLETDTSALLIEGEASYLDARFSPDARYVTYASNDSGRMEVYIQRIADGARWQLSTAGGLQPHWSDDGREIVYLDLDRGITAVSVDAASGQPELGVPRELFAVDERIVAFDPSGDHRRFLFATREDSAGGEPLHVIFDWPAGL